MNILVLCDRYPYPLAHGLTLRVYNVLCRLAKRHTLDLLCYGEGPPPGALTGLFRRIETFTKPQTSSKHAAPWVRLRQAFSLDHLHAVQPAMAHRIHELVESEDYALVLAYPNVLHYFASGLNIPLVVDLIDDHLLMYWRHLRVVHSPFEGLRLCKRWLMMYRFERRLAKVAKAIVVVSEADRDFMARFCQGAPLHVIPNGVNGDYYRPLGLEEEPYTLVFEGKMDFAPNVDGVRFFCQTVLPLVHRQLPQARLWVVGKDPTPEVLALAGERVTVTGFVDDVRPYLDRASLFVCPLRMGGGIKNKILQA
ncbi:MAG: glycosyltransferase family 4 protein, partial [Candidatus Competibacterales bacterium]